ncbi:MAG TPA: M48 family metalloprotease [Tepidisphaeraceae bacterium]|nr:M48 family metalloprotease [Tepidisphaeraceae bacterium]
MECGSQANMPCNPADAMQTNWLACAYQPRRLRGALLSVAWNLTWLAAFLHTGLANRPPRWVPFSVEHRIAWPVYLTFFYCLYALINFPIDLWYGYLHERQFGLVKHGLRAWGRDWVIGILQHGFMFVIGSCLIVALQVTAPATWLGWISLCVLTLFLISLGFAPQLIPPGLFEYEPADKVLTRRLQSLIRPLTTPLPPIILFTHPELRDFSGGLLGLGRQQILLISRSTIELGSDAVLRFVLLHEMGHRHLHHLLVSVFIGWVWVILGLVAGNAIVSRLVPDVFASPLYIPWLAMLFTGWMVLSYPALAYLGRRLEYQADRFYLRHGGTFEEMRTAIEELSQRNLARTDLTLRRQSLVQALPTPARRLRAAQMFLHPPTPTIPNA